MHQITRPIDDLGIIADRILHKRLDRLLGIVVISVRKTRAAYTQLALLGTLNQSIVGVENEHITFMTLNTDWERFGVVEFPIDDIICAVDGDLRRTVEISEHRLRQFSTPLIELLDWHDFAGEYDFLQAGDIDLVEHAQVRHRHQYRRHPKYHIDFVRGDVFEQSRREHERGARDDVERRAPADHLIDVEHGVIEVKRRLIADYIILVDVEGFAHPFGILHHRTLPDRDALRHARRPRCEQHIQHIHAIDFPRGCRQQRIIDRAVDQGIDVFLVDHERRLKCVKDFVHARRGHFGIDDGIKIARVCGAEHTDDRLNTLLEHDCDRLTEYLSTTQLRRHRSSRRAELFKRQSATLVRQSDLIGEFTRRLVKVIGDYAFHLISSAQLRARRANT